MIIQPKVSPFGQSKIFYEAHLLDALGIRRKIMEF